ncbi:nitroreductase family protein [Variovorax sp. dw_308]|uniref:nitroreductase family protein n=1 Tax=Variovorax sp. dw_308 TaxID=2721546 RepID=UPI001C44BF61
MRTNILGPVTLLSGCRLVPWRDGGLEASSAASPPSARIRQSIRRYTSAPVPASVLERILVAATSAASAHNRQPWRFVVVEEQRLKDQISDAMADRLRKDRTADGDAAQAVEADVLRSRSRIREAPVLIFVFATMEDMDQYPDAGRRQAEQTMAVQSTAMATQNLLNSAHEEQLGACVMCAPLFCADLVGSALGVPERWAAQALVTVGWPTVRGPIRARLPIDKVVWRLGSAVSTTPLSP